jgi:dCMP deaminase
MQEIETINKVKNRKPSFDDIYMNLAESLAQKSHCVKQKVGAVLTKDTRIVSLGYNGPPAGTHNCDEEWPQEGCARDRKGSCSLALHAEANAILYAAKNKVDMDGSTLYVTLSPCLPCARIIFSVGVKKVFYLNSYAAYKGIDSDEGVEFLIKFGIQVSQYNPTSNV